MEDGVKGPKYVIGFFAVAGLILVGIFWLVHASLNRNVFNANAAQIARTAPGPRLTHPNEAGSMQGGTSVPAPPSENRREPGERSHP